MVAAPSAYAQERSGFGSEENLKGQDELNPHIDSHANNTPSTVSSNPANSINREKENYRDSVAIKPVVGTVRNKAESSSQKKSEEETLSFNILYFIIQKFKVSDMMN